jgi:hypothetical protein
MSDEFAYKWNQLVKFTGGKYNGFNGFNGVMRWCGQTWCSVEIRMGEESHTVIEELKFISPQ